MTSYRLDYVIHARPVEYSRYSPIKLIDFQGLVSFMSWYKTTLDVYAKSSDLLQRYMILYKHYLYCGQLQVCGHYISGIYYLDKVLLQGRSTD